MEKNSTGTIYLGLDVHKNTIAACWVTEDGGTEETRQLPNDERQIVGLIKQLKKKHQDIRACYEAGPCGYEVRRLFERQQVACEVIAPSLIPKRAGDRVKTDKRDARKLARLYRAGELTTIRVPSIEEEAVRDLVRCREDAREDLQRHRHRLLKFLLRHGRVWRETNHWSLRHWSWLRTQKFEQPAAQRTFDEYLRELDHVVDRIRQLDQAMTEVADKEPWKPLVSRLRCFRGIDTLTALALLAEVQDFRRFESPRDLMSFLGLVPSLYASAGRESRGSITKTGNSHVRRLLVEAAWHYRHRPALKGHLRKRCTGQPEAVVSQAMKAQERLNKRWQRLSARGKPPSVVIVAMARELAAFVWAMAVKTDDEVPKA
jgi:transposase